MTRSIRGVVGRIDWGYYTAAILNGYSIKPTPDGSWDLRATLVNFDAFKLRQKPLVLVAPHANGEWRWPIRSIDVGTGDGPREVRATLGQQLPELVTK